MWLPSKLVKKVLKPSASRKEEHLEVLASTLAASHLKLFLIPPLSILRPKTISSILVSTAERSQLTSINFKTPKIKLSVVLPPESSSCSRKIRSTTSKVGENSTQLTKLQLI